MAQLTCPMDPDAYGNKSCVDHVEGRMYPHFPAFIGNMFGALSREDLEEWVEEELDEMQYYHGLSAIWADLERDKLAIYRAQQTEAGCASLH